MPFRALNNFNFGTKLVKKKQFCLHYPGIGATYSRGINHYTSTWTVQPNAWSSIYHGLHVMDFSW